LAGTEQATGNEDVMPTAVTYRRVPAHEAGEALHIQVSDAPSVLGIALLVSCSAGWLRMLASTASQALQHGSNVAGLGMVLRAVLLGGGVAVLVVGGERPSRDGDRRKR
jgi:hypothetical protein